MSVCNVTKINMNLNIICIWMAHVKLCNIQLRKLVILLNANVFWPKDRLPILYDSKWLCSTIRTNNTCIAFWMDILRVIPGKQTSRYYCNENIQKSRDYGCLLLLYTTVLHKTVNISNVYIILNLFEHQLENSNLLQN
jgi:hypothetical protein